MFALGLGPPVLEPIEQHRQVVPKMPRHVLYELSRGPWAEGCRLLAPADDELASLSAARDSLHAFPADFGKSHGAGFDVYVGGAVAGVQHRDLRLAARSRRDARQHSARALAEIEDRAVLEFYLCLPFGVDRQYVSLSQPHALGGGVERRAPYQLDAPFGQRQGARSLSKSGGTGAQ